MFLNFSGVYKRKISADNKITLPKEWVSDLYEIIVFPSDKNFIYLSDKNFYNKIINQQSQIRTILANTYMFKLNKKREFSLPIFFIEKFKLEQTIYLVGEGDHIKIISESNYLLEQKLEMIG